MDTTRRGFLVAAGAAGHEASGAGGHGQSNRAKGVVYSSDAPKRRAVLQVVGRRVDISLQEDWGERAPRTQIVAIGAAGSIDASLLEKAFASCISTVLARVPSPSPRLHKETSQVT